MGERRRKIVRFLPSKEGELRAPDLSYLPSKRVYTGNRRSQTGVGLPLL